ncbi:N-acetylmuramoyl-L-alanine amidase [Haploplasma axanthum]|uniref:N-acetylmuramoyl-L-alanine amidase n=1 Tax=Haploplasma axanthum TaxID=29552 RepID=A0A449BCW0_HAPAX|nr:N-acetylmuramoyl-L-alanine amidase [Haploplasma axanthum]VEU80293.1 N-acetylmuramoyl-L-alanine amidase CwlH precursor [Haploplasma axanthum]
MKKIVLSIGILVFFSILLVGCSKDKIEIKLKSDSVQIKVGEEKNVEFTTSDELGLNFESGDETVLTVNESGVFKGIKKGKTFIKITSKSNLKKTVKLDVEVYEGEIEILLVLKRMGLGIDTSKKIDLTTNDPLGLIYETSDETIVTVNSEGEVKGIKQGRAIITILSKSDSKVKESIEVLVTEEVAVKQGAKANDELVINDKKYIYGENLFATINDAVNTISSGIIIVDTGAYKENITFESDFELISNGKVTLEGEFKGNNISLRFKGFTFVGNTNIKLDNKSEFIFEENEVSVDKDFIIMNNSSQIKIVSNNIEAKNSTAITINDFDVQGDYLIEDNVITDSQIAILIKAIDKLERKANIKLYRNKIDNVNTAFDVDLGNKNKTGNYIAYGRFNEVTNYDVAINNRTEDKFEWTLNYWGNTALDMSKFINVDNTMLREPYKNAIDILSKKDYKPNVPVKVIIENPIGRIELGESYKFDVITIPYTASKTTRWVVSKQGLIEASATTNTFNPIQSGELNIKISSAANSNIFDTVDLIVTTDPGIHLTPSIDKQDILVGDDFTLTAEPFPYNYANKQVKFISSDENIATVDEGKVNVIGAGDFSITVKLLDDKSVFEIIEFTSYDELDDNNIIDFLVKRQMLYSKIRSFQVFGTSHNFTSTHYDSVSRLTYGEIKRNTDMIIPVTADLRPGTKKNSNIKEEYKFNDDNVVWIVMHETGSTSTASGAYSHAKYLMTQATTGVQRVASWHATIDSKELYQHIPFDEVAYHAGDGSVLPGMSSTYLGGGNRNGIGIEMAVNDDGNIMKTWQRAAKFAAELLVQYNLPTTQISYHQDFSGKLCPQSMIRADLQGLFEEFVENEYELLKRFPNVKSIELVSSNEEYLENTGVIVKNPNKTMTIEYDLIIKFDNDTEMIKTFKTYLPGMWK